MLVRDQAPATMRIEVPLTVLHEHENLPWPIAFLRVHTSNDSGERSVRVPAFFRDERGPSSSQVFGNFRRPSRSRRSRRLLSVRVGPQVAWTTQQRTAIVVTTDVLPQQVQVSDTVEPGTLGEKTTLSFLAVRCIAIGVVVIEHNQPRRSAFYTTSLGVFGGSFSRGGLRPRGHKERHQQQRLKRGRRHLETQLTPCFRRGVYVGTREGKRR